MSNPDEGRPVRSRRKAAQKAIDYGKEQEFSDAEDIFEDGSDEKPTPRAPRRSTGTRRPRKSVDTDVVAMDPSGESYRPARQYYVEKGYDPMLPSLRERFTFEPEMEDDGSPKIDIIVGRRPIEDKAPEKDSSEDEDEEIPSDDEEDDDSEGDDEGGRKRKSRRKKGKKSKKAAKNNGAATKAGPSKRIDYEYLVKYKGKSYLHLEWKTASDLESMNKSAKTLYRRFLKKLAAGTDEDLEDPEFDPAFIQPGKIVDEEEREILEELGDKELMEWEKERERELAEEEEEEEVEEEKKDEGKEGEAVDAPDDGGKEDVEEKDEAEEEIGEPGTLTIEQIRKIVNKDGPYYPTIEGSNNPYRDGYITEPPKKPRASYLFFQGVYRSLYQKKHAGKSVGEIMTILGDTWRAMSEAEQAPFVQLAQEEAAQHEKEKILLEKAQKASEVWQPLRRCEMVLDRLCEDGYSSIFREPVSLEDFPDYEDFVDHPMDLGTIREKLNNRKYQAPENFARDMRKIWNNCKIYNQHGSAIWHVADYMSKQFERLYHAWVLEFRNRYLRWVDPKARPWEHSCRACDGKCGTTDDKMVLCDHCDANYGMGCVRPPLTEVPDVWHCPDCAPKLGGEKGARMLSAVSEYAARKRAELGDIPKKKVKKKMFLVKWAGLGYEHCSWETAEDINDDALIAEFRRLNNMTPDEPELLEDDVKKVLDTTTSHITRENAGGSWNIPDLRAQLYSQTRAFQFSKFGMEIPKQLSLECGPKTKATALVPSIEGGSPLSCSKTQLVEEVVECVSGLVDKVCRGETRQTLKLSVSLPPLLTGEYDVVVPITSKGLMMNVGEIHGSVAFLGYRQFPDGSKGPSEIQNLIRNIGDKIIAVDGTSTINKSFKEVIMLLRESGKNKFAYMRFLENKYQQCNGELTSMGTTGLFAVEELYKKFKTDRRRLLVKRKQQLDDEEEADIEEKEEESDESVRSQGDSDEEDDSDASHSEDDFQPDSDDEELVIKQKVQEQMAAQRQDLTNPDIPKSDPTSEQGPKSASPQTDEKGEEKKDAMNGEIKPSPLETGSNVEKALSPNEAKSSSEKTFVCKQETTKSLAYRLLDIDIGYSSDECGDEDCAYFVDGADNTFTTKREVDGERTALDEGADVEGTEAKGSLAEELTLPVKRNEFSQLGERSKLVAAIALTNDEADPNDFDNYPLPSTKELEAKKKAEAEAKRALERLAKEKEDSEALDGTAQGTTLSKTKVEQVDTRTNEVVRVWAKAEDAAATLQINLNEIKQILKGEYSEDLGDEVGGYRWRYAAEDAQVTTKTGGAKSDKKSKEAFLEFRDKLYDHEHPHAYKNDNKLRDYQIDGVNWLASCWYKRHSCILADEMGLGKTVQIVSYIEHIYRVEKIQRPFLVVVPLSTVEHWRREFEGWTDMRCCVYHDRQRIWRDVMREYEWYYVDRPHTPEYLKFDVLVTTYDTLIGDFDVIGQIPWRVAVVDEAHRLRNVKGKLLECMKEISARGTLEYGFQSRVLMTGTPLQNNTQELWTLLNFIEPFKFPSLEEFEANFGDMNNRAQVEALQKKISPYMLRRVKEDVAKDIPAKEETLIDVELTSIQKQYYRAIFEHNHSFLSMGATRQSAPKLMNIQMELRKCCNHPFLLDGVETREMENHHKEFYESGAFDGKSPDEVQEILNLHGYIQTSGKMVLLDKLLPKLCKEGHKILIFSQMVKMLDLLSEYMDFRGFKHETLTGRVRGNERQKAIDRFNTEEDSFAFLLSTRAGGVGINLTAADICIIFDSDWNPQNDVQAQARCHRIGQTKDVMIYRLITSRTFEQEMFDRASRKLGLEQAVLGTFGQDDDDGKPTAKEMEQLLKKGAYALVEDDDEIGKEFQADDIESILAKRTRTRVVEGAKTANWLNKAGMNVTKSKFSGDSKSKGIDVDDPLFWQKVMPDFVTPTIMMDKLNELSEAVEEGPTKKGPGRGRWKKKATDKKADEADGGDTAKDEEMPAGEEDAAKAAVEEPAEQEKEDDQEAEESKSPGPKKKNASGKENLTRANQKKVNKFMGDLTSMMDDIFEQDEDDSLPQSEKAVCQKLLLTISVKTSLFTEEQRNVAKVLLKRLEGDRRRRCRTGGDEPARFASMNAADEAVKDFVPEELMIRSSKKKRRKKRKSRTLQDDEEEDVDEDEPERKKSKKSKPIVGEDGYLHHSDSEGDWSDVGDNIYEATRKRPGISKKEARRRRAWASDKDAATAAGRPWPSFPRKMVTKVLGTLLDEMIKYDQSKGGVFSVPVPRDDFPEYYEMVKKPMDYGTMKTKLANEEYRSAQAMQKDFILVMTNCLQFNAADSDIVKEARQQALMRPTLLKNAAMEHNLFIAEDGTILEVYDEEEEKKKAAAKKAEEKEAKAAAKKAEKEARDAEKKNKKKKKKKKKGSKDGQDGDVADSTRFVRCGKCDGCKREDCGECAACLDKPKFGGKGALKQGCHQRKCEKPQEQAVSSKGKKGKGKASKVASESEESGAEDVASGDEKKKPRIKISLSGKKGKGKSKSTQSSKKKKRKREEEEEEDGSGSDADDEGNAASADRIPSRKEKQGKKRKVEQAADDDDGDDPLVQLKSSKKGKKKKKGGSKKIEVEEDVKEESEGVPEGNDAATQDEEAEADSEGESENKDDPSNIYLDVDLLKNERLGLDGTFASARANFVKRGPWVLPESISANFSSIAKQTLVRMNRHDSYQIFFEEVTEDEAPGYSEVVKKPMDFTTMRRKIDKKEYGEGPEAAAAFYDDFLLVFDNCALYNDEGGEVMEEASRVFGLLPETFAAACVAIAGKVKNAKKR